MSMIFREFHYEVHTDCVPLMFQNGEQLEFSYWGLPFGLGSNAEVTGFHVLPNVSRHLRPAVVPRHEFQCFQSPGMPCHLGVMVLGHDTSLELKVLRDIYLSSEVEEAISLGPLG